MRCGPVKSIVDEGRSVLGQSEEPVGPLRDAAQRAFANVGRIPWATERGHLPKFLCSQPALASAPWLAASVPGASDVATAGWTEAGAAS